MPASRQCVFVLSSLMIIFEEIFVMISIFCLPFIRCSRKERDPHRRENRDKETKEINHEKNFYIRKSIS